MKPLHDWLHQSYAYDQIDQARAQLEHPSSYGRVVFTLKTLPVIRPVNHLVDQGQIVIRTRLTSAISTAAPSREGVVVAYEADSIDPQAPAGWSVVVTGRAYSITDAGQVLRYEQLLKPWVNHADTVIAIEPEIITGLHIAGAPL